MEYDVLVKEGRALIKPTVAPKDRLELGNLALKACGPPGSGQGSRTDLGKFSEVKTLDQYATDLGLAEPSDARKLSNYRATAWAWDQVSSADEIPWTLLNYYKDYEVETKQAVVNKLQDQFGEDLKKTPVSVLKNFLNPVQSTEIEDSEEEIEIEDINFDELTTEELDKMNHNKIKDLMVIGIPQVVRLIKEEHTIGGCLYLAEDKDLKSWAKKMKELAQTAAEYAEAFETESEKRKVK